MRLVELRVDALCVIAPHPIPAGSLAAVVRRPEAGAGPDLAVCTEHAREIAHALWVHDLETAPVTPQERLAARVHGNPEGEVLAADAESAPTSGELGRKLRPVE